MQPQENNLLSSLDFQETSGDTLATNNKAPAINDSGLPFSQLFSSNVRSMLGINPIFIPDMASATNDKATTPENQDGTLNGSEDLKKIVGLISRTRTPSCQSRDDTYSYLRQPKSDCRENHTLYLFECHKPP
jgi:hypothetical protein